MRVVELQKMAMCFYRVDHRDTIKDTLVKLGFAEENNRITLKKKCHLKTKFYKY